MAVTNSVIRMLKNRAELSVTTSYHVGVNYILHRKISNSCSYRAPVNLAYSSYESANESGTSVTSPPVLIMHGLFGSKTNWNTLAKAIHLRTKRKVIAVDARNHGDSPHTPIMSYTHMAKDIAKLLESLDINKAILIGHSMGGSAVMCTALDHPNLVKKLIVVDMSPVRTSDSLSEMGQIFDAMLSIELPQGSSLSETRKVVDQQLAEKIHSDMLRQFLLMNLVEHEPGKYKWRVNLPVLAENFAHQIAVFPTPESKTYDGPTLFIGGADSDYIKQKDFPAIKKLFPNAELRYVAGAGHWVQSQKPAEFLDMTVDFINKRDP